MRRRRFLKAVLGAGVAAALPWKVYPDPGWGPVPAVIPAKPLNTVTTLEGIFKHTYANRFRTHMIPALHKRIEDDQRKLSELVFSQPITLKHENGFTE